MTSPQGVPAALPDATRGWRLVLDLPVLAAAVTTAAALATTACQAGAGSTSPPLWAAVTGPGASAGTTGAVLLVVSLLVGLPHGAVDLLRPDVVPPDASPRRRRVVGAAYAGCAVAAACCWLLLPLPTLVLLLLLAAAHFGAADDVTARWKGMSPPPTSWAHRVPRIVAAGGLPVAVPLGLHGDAVRQVLSGLSGGHAGAVIAGAQISSLPVLAATAWVLGTALVRRRWVPAVEVMALTALFAVVTPLLAFAVYFGLWHSWRQVARMVGIDTVREQVSPARALRTFCRTALLPTALTVSLAVAAVLLGGRSVLVVGLASVLCLTVPHSLAVARADRSLRPPVEGTASRRDGRSPSAPGTRAPSATVTGT